MSTKKQCTGPCGEKKDLSEFAKRNDTPDGRRAKCRKCQKSQCKSYPRTENKIECKGCNKEKPSIEFPKQKNLQNGVGGKCLECKRKEREQKAKQRKQITEKECKECGDTRPVSEYLRLGDRGDGYGTCCRKCRPTYEPIKAALVMCTGCGVEQSPSKFHRDKSNKTGLCTTSCKACRADDVEEYMKMREQKKVGQKCIQCHYDQDHRVFCLIPRDRNHPALRKRKREQCRVSMVRNKHAQDLINQSDILCKNCERFRLLGDRTYKSKKEELILQLKLKHGSCIDCKLHVTPSNSCIFDFDHIDPSTKIDAVTVMAREKRYDMTDIDEEVKKCNLRCSNCHWIVTIERGQVRKRINYRTTTVTTTTTTKTTETEEIESLQ